VTERVAIEVDGARVEANAGDTLAATLANLGLRALRRSVNGEPRGALCGMGVCGECRVTLDGRAHVRACAVSVRAGQRVETRRA
jgi:aerobic-type carbon monoxide dehydrogenase small subunit (CoxS/CutS family)